MDCMTRCDNGLCDKVWQGATGNVWSSSVMNGGHVHSAKCQLPGSTEHLIRRLQDLIRWCSAKFGLKSHQTKVLSVIQPGASVSSFSPIFLLYLSLPPHSLFISLCPLSLLLFLSCCPITQCTGLSLMSGKFVLGIVRPKEQDSHKPGFPKRDKFEEWGTLGYRGPSCTKHKLDYKASFSSCFLPMKFPSRTFGIFPDVLGSKDSSSDASRKQVVEEQTHAEGWKLRGFLPRLLVL